MQFMTNEECREWMRGRGQGDGDWPTLEESPSPQVKGRLGFAFADAFRLSSIFSYDSEVLLWVTATRIWSANLHLYYRFREGYGDRRLVEQAPGHLFLNYEKTDLLSYLQIIIQNGWDFYALGAEDYARLFVSHDEYFVAAVADDADRERLSTPPANLPQN